MSIGQADEAHPSAATFQPLVWHMLALGPVAGVLSGTLSYWLQYWINPAIASHPIGAYSNVVLFNVLAWTTWFLTIPGIWRLADRVRIARTRLVGAVMLHATASLLLAMAVCVIIAAEKYGLFAATGVVTLGRRPMTYALVLKEVLLETFEWKVLLYWGVVGAHHASAYASEVRQREVSESRLQRRLVEARLDALQRQLNPHFLFNTLHAITSVVHRDPDTAESMLVRLSQLLRAVVRTQSRHEVTLTREIQLLGEYVEIERLRFGSKLRVDFDIPEAVGEGLVPVLLLQPLVENAFKHAFSHQSSGGVIRVSARRTGDRLTLTVADTGRGVSADQLENLREGVGLANTRARFEHLYPDQHQVTVGRSAAGGFEVALTLPWHVPAASVTDEVAVAAVGRGTHA